MVFLKDKMTNKFSFKDFTKEDSNFLKGIAIIFIVLHNLFLHIIPKIGQNEFWFSENCYKNFLIIIKSNPLEIINSFFDFFGHYGVQAFIVLSAYGITKSYETKKPKYFSFIFQRIQKIYPAFILSAILYIIISIIKNYYLDNETIEDLLIQLFLVANFIPGKAMVINGPWWFFSFIFQFYFVFPLLYRLLIRFGEKSLIIVGLSGIVLSYFLYKPLINQNINIYHLLIGHIPELCLGMIVAYKKEIKLPVWIIILFSVLFVFGNVNYYLWPLTNLSASILFIFSIKYFVILKNKYYSISKVITYIGVISLFIFSTHGLIRKGFINLANSIDSPFYSLLIASIYLLTSIIVGYLLYKIENYSGEKLFKKKRLYIPSLFLILLVLIFIMIKNNSVQAYNTSKFISDTIKYDFKDDNLPEIDANDSIGYSGNRLLKISESQPFSSSITYDFKQDSVKFLNHFTISSMVYAINDASDFCYVIEIFHKSSKRAMFYQAESINADKIKLNNWVEVKYELKLPGAFKSDKFGIKTYIWKNTEGEVYIANYKLIVNFTLSKNN